MQLGTGGYTITIGTHRDFTSSAQQPSECKTDYIYNHRTRLPCSPCSLNHYLSYIKCTEIKHKLKNF